jgi:hypothetical protein
MLGASVPVVAEIEPAAGLIWFAADAAKVLFRAGLVAEAMAWYRLAEGEAGANADARAVADGLWPLAQIVDDKDELPWRPDGLAAWARATTGAGGEDAPARTRSRALMMYSVLQALGEPIGPDAWNALLDKTMTTTTTFPDAALVHALDEATRQRQIGLTVLLALLALGDRDLATANPLIVAKAVSAFGFIGLPREARGLALEAAAGTGL